MNKAYYKNLINEVMSEFDFLGNDKRNTLQEASSLLGNEDFQKQFICDSIVERGKIKSGSGYGNLTSDFNEDRISVNFEYRIEVGYKFDSSKNPAKFTLVFDGTNGIEGLINTSNDSGDNITPPSNTGNLTQLNWGDVNVYIETQEDNYEFTAYDTAPDKIKELFVREYLEDFLGDEIGIDVDFADFSAKNVSYC